MLYFSHPPYYHRSVDSEGERKYLADRVRSLEKQCELLKSQNDFQLRSFESKMKMKNAEMATQKVK